MYFKQLLHALQFDNKLLIYQQINPITTVKFRAFVANRQIQLKLERNLGSTEFRSQALFICGFKQPRAKLTMDFDGTADDFVRQLIKNHIPL